MTSSLIFELIHIDDWYHFMSIKKSSPTGKAIRWAVWGVNGGRQDYTTSLVVDGSFFSSIC